MTTLLEFEVIVVAGLLRSFRVVMLAHDPFRPGEIELDGIAEDPQKRRAGGGRNG